MFNVCVIDITNTCLLPGFDVKRWLWYLPHPALWPPTRPKRILHSTHTLTWVQDLYTSYSFHLRNIVCPINCHKAFKRDEQIWGANLCWKLSSIWTQSITYSSRLVVPVVRAPDLSFYLPGIKWVNWPVFQFCLTNYVREFLFSLTVWRPAFS